MEENLLIGLASIIVLGIGAQWLAWVLRLPSILLLLVAGLVAGPTTGFLNPDGLLGDLLLPIVSLSVAVILFEGGLNLKISELRQSGSIVRNLVTLGTLITWVVGTLAAYLIFDLDFKLAVLLGAILVVTGPTVIMPMLRYLRPGGRVGPILKWEGIVIDPIGAVLALLVFEAVFASGFNAAAVDLLRTILFGGAAGLLGALLLIEVLRRYWLPDFLHSVFALALAIAAYGAANQLQTESGLIAVTLMGIILANQKRASIRHITEFKENLSILLISGLFILLAARLDFGQLDGLGGSFILLVVLMFIARPLAVFASTIRSSLSTREKVFLSWMAPRGIVAAAVASIFGLRLTDAGYAGGELLVSLAFVIIAGTVTVYGLSAPPVARWLKVAEPNPQGVVIVGGHPLGRAVAAALKEEKVKVILVDTNWANISAARMAGIPTFYANILSQYALEGLDLGGIGRLLALTTDDEFNTLVTQEFGKILGRNNVYQLPPDTSDKAAREAVSHHLRGRYLFAEDASYNRLNSRFAAGASIKTTVFSKEFSFEDFKARYGEETLPFFAVDQNGKLVIFATEKPPQPQPGQKLISLTDTATSTQSAAKNEQY